jgi:methylated-DNA-protein-cysteine methyltransferase related protein
LSGHGVTDPAEPTTGSVADRILACVASIPNGSVMTYGDVAEYVGTRSARIVGRVLAADGGSVPWHRVLRADGTMADHLVDEQTQLLRSEGVRVVNGRADLGNHRWDGR